MLISLKAELCAYSRPSSETAITRGNKLAKHICVSSCGQNIGQPVGDWWNLKEHLDNNLWLRHQVLDTLKLLAANKLKVKTICFFFYLSWRISLQTVGSEVTRPTQPSGKIFADKCSFKTRQQGCDPFRIELGMFLNSILEFELRQQTGCTIAVFIWFTLYFDSRF